MKKLLIFLKLKLDRGVFISSFTVSVTNGKPVLTSMDGLTFAVPVVLEGNLLIYKGPPKHLVTVIGKCCCVRSDFCDHKRYFCLFNIVICCQ